METAQRHQYTLTDWNEALRNGWTIISQTGNWNIETGRLHLTTDGLQRLELADFHHSGPFALDVRMRFLSIGLMDNDTHQDAFLSIEVAGARITIIGDRYMVDDDCSPLQYVIFRSDPGVWHDWRFEIDPEAGEIALVRDGEYRFLHAILGKRPSGLRFELHGSPTLLAGLELAEIQVELLPHKERSRPIDTRPVEETASGEWPMFRRDRLNSGHSPLTGTFGDSHLPQLDWSYSLGGWTSDVFTADLDQDGKDEVLVMMDGSIAAFRSSGERLWQQKLELPAFICSL